MASRLWQPLGAGSDASWSLDSKRSGFEKMESGLNATALDYARFGLLFLCGGEWNGRRIVSREWVRAATRIHTATDYPNPYGYFWWIDGKRPDRSYAFGNYGQYIYVDPTRTSSWFASVATGGSATKHGWRFSVTSPTSSPVDLRPEPVNPCETGQAGNC